MSIDFSVAIRTYNGEKRLPEVLDRLQQQTSTEGIRWEVLVIDNNSQDNTAAVVAQYAQQWRQDSKIRCVLEPKQGSAYARDRALLEAAGDLVGFLDDDNLPSETWVAESVRFGRAHPEAGAFGGNIYPKLDIPIPDNFAQFCHLLTVGSPGSSAYQYSKGMVPVTPGSVIRLQAWRECVPDRRRLRGRDISRKFIASSAEDIEAMTYLHSSRWQIWHNPAIEVWHIIPAKRLERDYLLKVALNSGLSAYACFIAELKPWQRPFAPLMIPAFVTVRSYRLSMYYLKHRREFASDLPKACQLRLMTGRLLSPFLTPRPQAYNDSSEPRPGAVNIAASRVAANADP